MKMKITTRALIAGAALALVVSTGALAADRPDSWITMKTKLALMTTEGIDTWDLNVDTVSGGVTLHGTGIHPGGITERFPLMISALSGSITHVRAEEFSDIRTYNAPGVISDIMLFGKTPEEAVKRVQEAKRILDAV